MRRKFSAAQLCALVASVLLSTAPAGHAAADAVEADKEKLRGYWTVVSDSRKESGRAQPFLYFTNDKLVDWQEREYVIDPTQTPKHINLRGTNWQGAAFDQRGIYELSDDALRICWGIPATLGQPNRPSAFQTNKPNGGVLLILQRGDPNEGEFTCYGMETQVGTLANRKFRDEHGRVTVTIYYGAGPVYGVVPENLHVQSLDIDPHDRRVDRLSALSQAVLRHLASSQGFDVRYATDNDLEALSTLKGLQTLSINCAHITQQGLGFLKTLPRLERLTIGGAAISNQAMIAFRHWPQLRDLSLIGVNVDERGLGEVKAPLTALRLENLPITDAGLKHVKRFPELTSLRLLGLQLSDRSLQNLRDLRHLELLQIDNIPIDGSGFVHLKELSQLRHLLLENTRVTDSALVHLNRLHKLESLYITNAEITDHGLKHLHGLKKLHTFNYHNTYVTSEAVRELEALLLELHRR